MKRLNSYFMTGMMALAMLSSCNNEDNPAGEYQPEGRDAIATFKLVIGSAGSTTRAESEEGTYDGSTAEQAVNSLTLLVFNNTGAADVNTFQDGAKLESVMTINDLGAKNIYTAKVETTEGKKIAIALANNPTTGDNAIKYEMGVTDYKTFMTQTFLAAKMGADNKAVVLPIVSAENGIQMVSAPAGVDVVAGKANNTDLTLERLAAKVQMSFPATVGAAANFEPTGLTMTFSDARYFLAQYQTTMQVAKPAVGTGVPGGSVTAHTEFPDLAKWNTPGDNQNWGEAPDRSVYVSENIMSSETNPKRNQTTAVLVKTTISFTKTSNNGAATNGTFHAICKFESKEAAAADPLVWKTLDAANPYYGVYHDLATANAALANIPQEKEKYAIVTFTNGISYYRLNLQDNTQQNLGGFFSVKRNSYYRITVTQINNIGWPNPGDLVDPNDNDDAEDKRVGIEAKVNIDPWKVIIQNSPLQ